MEINFPLETMGMRKIINISAFVFFVWLLLDTFKIVDGLLYFLLMGELPGTSVQLPPSIMLALTTLSLGLIVFEFSARRLEFMRRIRQQAIAMMTRREQLPRRRFTRI